MNDTSPQLVTQAACAKHLSRLSRLAEADRLLDEWTRAVAQDDVADIRPIWARRYWRIRNDRARLPEIKI